MVARFLFCFVLFLFSLVFLFYVLSTCVQNNNWITESLARWMETVWIETRFWLRWCWWCDGLRAVDAIAVRRTSMHTECVIPSTASSVGSCVCVLAVACYYYGFARSPPSTYGAVSDGVGGLRSPAFRMCECVYFIFVVFVRCLFSMFAYSMLVRSLLGK